jgi:hypothetical protein
MGWPKIIVHLEVEVINFFCVCVKIILSQIVTKFLFFFQCELTTKSVQVSMLSTFWLPAVEKNKFTLVPAKFYHGI